MFLVPFSLSIEPIQQLLLVSFKGDPEYDQFELQSFDDEIYGKGIRVLLYRQDNFVDVYWQKGVQFDPQTFAIGSGIGNAAEVPMAKSHFEINSTGVEVDLSFEDAQGRQIELQISEHSSAKNRFSFLAPVGNDIKKPNRLFLVHMQGFDFLRKSGTIIKARLGDRSLGPASFPILRNHKTVYFSRYASKLVIGEINNSNRKIQFVELTDREINADGFNLIFDENNELTSCWLNYNSDRVEICFVPGFPNALEIPSQTSASGSWDYSVSGERITGGTYSLIRENNTASIEMDVTKKWNPKDAPLSLKLMTRILTFFSTWPTKYKWKCAIDLKNTDTSGGWFIKE